MNNYCLTFSVIPCLLLVSACASAVDRAPNSASVELQAVKVPMAADYPIPAKSDYNIDLTLNGETIDDTLMLMEPPVQVNFTVWGYNEMMADVAATKITTIEFALRPQKVVYSLRFSKQEIDAIQPRSGAVEALKFYIALEVDTNGDGVVCNGDYRQNFTVSRPEFYSVMRTDVERELSIIEIQGEEC